MSYDFDGSNDYILSTSVPTSSTPVTLACWFDADTASGTEGLVTITDSAGNNGVRMTTNTGKIRAVVEGAGNAEWAETTVSFSANVWNHGCAVFSSSTSRTIYLNGGNAITDTVSRTPGTSTRFHIGASRNSSVTSGYFNGSIADVGVWNVALSAAEVASLAKGVSSLLIRPQNLIFYAPLIRELFDYSKTMLSLTNSGGAIVLDHPRIYL